MARSNNNLKAVLEDTANAIRNKTGGSALIVPRDFADEISNIPSGGSTENEDALIERNAVNLVNNTASFVGSGAFKNFNTLVSIELTNVSIIYSSAFYSCSNLTTISFPKCQDIDSDEAFAFRLAVHYS